jgi:hypothetical protein
MTAELELIFLCAGPSGDDSACRITDLLGSERIDWLVFERIAVEQGLVSVVYRRLRKLPQDLLPANLLARLRDHHQTSVVKSLNHVSVLQTLLRFLDARGIKTIPFKGPVLAAFSYGDPHLRSYGDLDLLIRKRDVREAVDALASMGYRPELPLAGAQGLAYLQFYNELGLIRDDGKVLVELQWQIVPWSYAHHLDIEALFERSRTIQMQGETVPALPPEELLMILCVHGTKHFWEKLIWLCDVAWTVSTAKDLDWERALAVSTTEGVRRVLLLGVGLSRDLFHLKLPIKVERAVDSEPGLRILSSKVKKHLLTQDRRPEPLTKKLLLFYMARERRQDRVHFAVRTLINAFLVAWKPVVMPRSLLPLYFVTRPFCVAAKNMMPLLTRHAGR